MSENIILKNQEGEDVVYEGVETVELLTDSGSTTRFIPEDQKINAKIEQTATGARITVSDRDGSTSADISNGTSVTHSWNGTTLTVTSASGTSSADLKANITVDSKLSETSTNPVRNSAVYAALDTLRTKLDTVYDAADNHINKIYPAISAEVKKHKEKLEGIAEGATKVEVVNANGRIRINDTLQTVYSSADKVVSVKAAQSSTGGWSYRRWNNNYGECWKTVSMTVNPEDFVDSGMMSLGGMAGLIGNGFGLYWTKNIPITFQLPLEFESKTEVANMTNSTDWFPLMLISTENVNNVTARENEARFPVTYSDSYRICTYKVPDEPINITVYIYVCGSCRATG